MGSSDVVAIGRLLGDPTRVALLDALFDNRAYTVSELARHTSVAVSTASEHLARLLDCGLVTTEAQGRHRYYRLAGPDVATLLETVFEFASDAARPIRRASRVPSDMAFARSCYDHLAGTVAVALADRLIEIGAIAYDDTLPRLTDIGRDLFAAIGIIPISPVGATRPVVRHCLDWSERRHHLGGALPAALLSHMLSERWCTRRSSRALRFTELGRHHVREQLGLDLSRVAGAQA
jgi:DNA-binding transcriptional ArsR family regulator